MTRDPALLLGLARRAIEASLRGGEVPLPDLPWLQTPAAVFVTLHRRRDGELRGCVGSIEPRLPLGRAVVSAARAAAFRDTRFPPLGADELAGVRLEVSVLSPLRPLPVADEDEARRVLAELRPGVVFRYGPHQSVLLPRVWEAVEDADEFLTHLKLKAGLPSTFWSDGVELDVFTSEEFAETNERPAEVGT